MFCLFLGGGRKNDTPMKIDDAVTGSTTRCRYNFSCLSCEKSCMCKPKDSIGHGMIEVKSSVTIGCGYRVSFGATHFCNCPTRVEIYNRYKQ